MSIESFVKTEKMFEEFSRNLMNREYDEISIFYNFKDDNEMFTKLKYELDCVLRLRNENQKHEEDYEGKLEMKIMSHFVDWQYIKDNLYEAKLNSNGLKLINKWNKYINS